MLMIQCGQQSTSKISTKETMYRKQHTLKRINIKYSQILYQ